MRTFIFFMIVIVVSFTGVIAVCAAPDQHAAPAASEPRYVHPTHTERAAVKGCFDRFARIQNEMNEVNAEWKQIQEEAQDTHAKELRPGDRLEWKSQNDETWTVIESPTPITSLSSESAPVTSRNGNG